MRIFKLIMKLFRPRKKYYEIDMTRYYHRKLSTSEAVKRTREEDW